VAKGFITLSGLTTTLITNNPPLAVATALGHLDRARKNLRSSRPLPWPSS
jgi:hypothetical protein